MSLPARDLDKVAGPVGEAIFMTAQVSAWPCPGAGYKSLHPHNRVLLGELDAFAQPARRLATGARMPRMTMQRCGYRRRAPRGRQMSFGGFDSGQGAGRVDIYVSPWWT